MTLYDEPQFETKEDVLRTRVKGALIRILKDEDRNAQTMLELVKKDSRIGYEGSYGYFYTPVELLEKIFDLRQTLQQLSG